MSNFLTFKADLTAPFWSDVLNGSENKWNLSVPHAFMQLTMLNRALAMEIEIGLKTRGMWPASQIKSYFGITGTKATMLPKLEEIEDLIREQNPERCSGKTAAMRRAEREAR
jgi:hypothetical protein